MDKFTAQRTQPQPETNDLRNHREDSGSHVRTLSDFELQFVGGGDNVPDWGGHP